MVNKKIIAAAVIAGVLAFAPVGFGARGVASAVPSPGLPGTDFKYFDDLLVPDLDGVDVLNIPYWSQQGWYWPVALPTVPGVTLPTVPTVPGVTLPTVPTLTLPTVPTVPGVTLPTVPTLTLPTLPTVPTVTLPTLPTVTLPTL
ncbi:hypothetical protein ACIA48_10700 [Mycobacterium sp. NPDC051804]|uniref:hypothetical protein n=1 Tax=Mycobacterium sp. NPDC051804 TaxID=3364295 RepID=UPI0037BB2F22